MCPAYNGLRSCQASSNKGLNGGGAAALEGLAGGEERAGAASPASLPSSAGDEVCFEGGCPSDGKEQVQPERCL